MTTENTQLTAQTVAASASLCMFASSELFELVQRQAKLIAASDLIPKQFQNNVANCAIALEMASRLGASPFAVIQNIDVIHGRPSWRAVFMMGLVNSCGRFTPLQFRIEVTGAERTVELVIESWENQKKVTRPFKYTYTPTRCVAWAREKFSGDMVEGPPVSYDMAIEEGWVSKSGSKWQTGLRELMLRYRAASFFAKVHASDLMLGMQTAEESYDIGPSLRNVTPYGGPTTTEERVDPFTPPPETATAAEPAPAAKAQRRTRTAAAPPTGEPSNETPPPVAEPMPERQVIVKGIIAAYGAAKLSLAQAQDRARHAGLLGPDRENDTFTNQADAALYQVYKVKDTLFTATTDPSDQAP